jgi:rubrerythrin
MTTNSIVWSDTLIHLFALAARLEGEGQYNLAKLARAAADSLSRHAAYRQAALTASQELATDVRVIAAELSHLGVSAELLSALTHGADLMAKDELPLITVAPHPYVCRTCGYVALAEPATTCPTCGAWPGTFQRFMPNYESVS